MDIDQSPIIEYSAYALTLAVSIYVQHMAFRTPQWKRRELARRFIGDTSVLVLFALFLLIRGTADFATWLGIVGGFAIAGVVKVAAAWYDKSRHSAMMEQFDEQSTGQD